MGAYISTLDVVKPLIIIYMKRSATLFVSFVMLFVIVSINTRLTIKILSKILMRSPHYPYKINVNIYFSYSIEMRSYNRSIVIFKLESAECIKYYLI